jgi:hypothetical protein
MCRHEFVVRCVPEHEDDRRPDTRLRRCCGGSIVRRRPVSSADISPSKARQAGPGQAGGDRGEHRERQTAQLMRGTTERLVDAAQSAAASARLPGDEPSLAIAVSCVGRRLYLGQRVEDELEAVTSGLGPNCGVVGFYSYGELSPVAAGTCDLHNQTMTITVLRERAA